MSSITIKTCFGFLLWGALLVGTLSIAQWPGNWGHGICGPWGCGPPMQALVSCHLAWLVFLTPPAVLLLRQGRFSPRRLGLALILMAVVALLSVIAYQRATWWPDASEWQRPFFWQRCGFCIVTAIDFPIVQTLAIGALLLFGSLRRVPQASGGELIAVPHEGVSTGRAESS